MNGSERPVWATVNLENVGDNVSAIKQVIGGNCQLLAVVKANGYGHGDVAIARTALANGATWLGVALPEEGHKLRREGIAAPILVLGALSINQLESCVAKDLILTVYQWEIAQALSNIARRLKRSVKVHVKVDTGMSRIGISPESAVPFIKRLQGLPGIEVQGIFTHFAAADQVEETYSQWQWQRFSWVLLELKKANINIPIKHCANTAATLLLDHTHLDMVRVGLGIYGLYPCDHSIELKPALSFSTEVVEAKRVSPGTAISYGCTYVTWKETTIVTLPVGYADGLARNLSSKGFVLINGKKYPFAGKITMDHCMVDVGNDQVEIGDRVTLIGAQKGQEISVDDWANWLETINYEIICGINQRVPRIY